MGVLPLLHRYEGRVVGALDADEDGEEADLLHEGHQLVVIGEKHLDRAAIDEVVLSSDGIGELSVILPNDDVIGAPVPVTAASGDGADVGLGS